MSMTKPVLHANVKCTFRLRMRFAVVVILCSLKFLAGIGIVPEANLPRVCRIFDTEAIGKRTNAEIYAANKDQAKLKRWRWKMDHPGWFPQGMCYV